MRTAATAANRIARTAGAFVRRSRCPDLANAISARQSAEGKSGWLALPAMSIAMALLARLAARGDSDCTMLERDYRDKWANLARYAPELVAVDLVLAEALVIAAYEQSEEPS